MPYRNGLKFYADELQYFLDYLENKLLHLLEVMPAQHRASNYVHQGWLVTWNLPGNNFSVPVSA